MDALQIDKIIRDELISLRFEVKYFENGIYILKNDVSFNEVFSFVVCSKLLTIRDFAQLFEYYAPWFALHLIISED